MLAVGQTATTQSADDSIIELSRSERGGSPKRILVANGDSSIVTFTIDYDGGDSLLKVFYADDSRTFVLENAADELIEAASEEMTSEHGIDSILDLLNAGGMQLITAVRDGTVVIVGTHGGVTAKHGPGEVARINGMMALKGWYTITLFSQSSDSDESSSSMSDGSDVDGKHHERHRGEGEDEAARGD